MKTPPSLLEAIQYDKGNYSQFLSKEDFDKLLSLDPTPSQKFGRFIIENMVKWKKKIDANSLSDSASSSFDPWPTIVGFLSNGNNPQVQEIKETFSLFDSLTKKDKYIKAGVISSKDFGTALKDASSKFQDPSKDSPLNAYLKWGIFLDIVILYGKYLKSAIEQLLNFSDPESIPLDPNSYRVIYLDKDWVLAEVFTKEASVFFGRKGVPDTGELRPQTCVSQENSGMYDSYMSRLGAKIGYLRHLPLDSVGLCLYTKYSGSKEASIEISDLQNRHNSVYSEIPETMSSLPEKIVSIVKDFVNTPAPVNMTSWETFMNFLQEGSINDPDLRSKALALIEKLPPDLEVQDRILIPLERFPIEDTLVILGKLRERNLKLLFPFQGGFKYGIKDLHQHFSNYLFACKRLFPKNLLGSFFIYMMADVITNLSYYPNISHLMMEFPFHFSTSINSLSISDQTYSYLTSAIEDLLSRKPYSSKRENFPYQAIEVCFRILMEYGYEIDRIESFFNFVLKRGVKPNTWDPEFIYEMLNIIRTSDIHVPLRGFLFTLRDCFIDEVYFKFLKEWIITVDWQIMTITEVVNVLDGILFFSSSLEMPMFLSISNYVASKILNHSSMTDPSELQATSKKVLGLIDYYSNTKPGEKDKYDTLLPLFRSKVKEIVSENRLTKVFFKGDNPGKGSFWTPYPILREQKSLVWEGVFNSLRSLEVDCKGFSILDETSSSFLKKIFELVSSQNKDCAILLNTKEGKGFPYIWDIKGKSVQDIELIS